MFAQSSVLHANGRLAPNDLHSARPQHNLPSRLTNFVGRTKEKRALQQLLSSTRLVTVTGTGGSGKTRLCLEVVYALVDDENLPFPDGIYWIELATLTDPTLVTQTVISNFGWHEVPDRAPIDLLIDVLAHKTTLLVLDNCEHLVTACAVFVDTLLRACPHLRILATSREPLGVVGETVWLTPALDPAEAMGLFLARATAVTPGFTATEQNKAAVAQLCQQVEGLPLALELAAARLKVLSVEQITARLADALHLLVSDCRTLPARQRTMQATLDWSYALLSPQEQSLFGRLAVFAGSFDLAAAEAVCSGQGIDCADLLDLMSLLVNKSLVVVEHSIDAARYRLLEPVRQYALEKLQVLAAETHWRTHHLAWYVSLVEQIQPALTTSEQVRWLDRLELELANLRVAFAWSQTHRSTALLGARLVLALQPFWNLHTRRTEGRRWLAQVTTSQVTLPADLHARALFYSGRLAHNQQDFAAACNHFLASLAHCRTAQLPRQTARALEGLGLVYLTLGEEEQAATVLQESLATAQAVGAPAEVGMAQRALGMLAQTRQAYAQARQWYEASLSCWQTLGDHEHAGQLLQNLGFLALSQRDYSTARTYYLECLALHQHQGNKSEARALIGLAAVFLQEGHADQAQALYAESLTILQAVNNKQRIVDVLNHLARLAQQQGATAKAQTIYTEALALRDQVLKTSVIETLVGLGDLAQTADDIREARNHYTQALAIARPLGRLPAAIVDPASIRLALTRTPDDPSWRDLLHTKLAELLAPASPSRARGMGSTNYSHTVQPQDTGRLQIFALGPMQVFIDGRQLLASDWGYRHAKELLLYLLLHASATREEIALEFWPDASTAQVRSRFSAVLAHTRKALGRDFEWIPFADGRYTFNHNGAYWFDVEEFEAKLCVAHTHLRQTPRQPSTASAELESAVALYQGDFVADLKDGQWYQSKRTQLQQALTTALLTLGRLHADGAHYEQAAATYQRLLTHDPHLEAAHRELMCCLAHQGEFGLALRQYKTLASSLHELDATPSPETEALVERLHRGERV